MKMYQSLILFASLAFAATAAFWTRPPSEDQRVSASSEAVQQEPVRPDTVNLRDYAHLRDGDDWAPAIEQAARDAGTVYIPSGRYSLRRTAYLVRDSTHLYGDGARSLLDQKTPGQHALEVNQSAFGTQPDDILVERLGFTGPPSPWTFALVSVDGHRVRFRGNRVSGIGGFRSVLTNEISKQTATDLEVVDNTLDGGETVAGTFGVLLENTRDARVRGNRIANYDKGIQWWGGEADPERPDFSRVRRAGHMVIDSNTVNNTVAAIWGSNGEHILVRHNRVAHCQDVCLDAEGSHEIRFVENEARFAGTAVLAVFHRSTNVVFEGNVVEQKGGFPDRPEQPAGRAMFASRNPSGDPADISTTLRGNRFTYSGEEGVGVVRNHALRRLVVEDNQFTNTVLELKQSRGGEVRVVDNQLWFQGPSPSREPISVSPAGGSRAEVRGNQIRRGKPQ